jgi:mannose-6-phosphate isomerase-like protein (cupin superfamily)
MVTLLLLTWLQAAPAQPALAPAFAQATTPARPTTQARPAQPARKAAAPAGTTLSVTVTDSVGAVLEGVTVSLVGLADRRGTTTAEGRLRLLNVPAGTHRIRFEREGYHTFEKELAWRAGQAAPSMTVTLNAAPPPPEPPPPPAPEPAKADLTLPPPSAPKTMALPDYIERNFISNKEAHKENIVGCSGVGQAMVWQVREAWTDRQHESADAMLYVIGGAGTLRLDGRDVTLAAGSFAVVPRGTGYGFTPRGRNPLIVLAFLAGAPCAVN